MERLTLIFDLDDTIIESFPGYVKLHQSVAGELKWRVPDEDELTKYGPTWEATVARIWPGIDLAPFFKRFEEILESVVYAPFDGVLTTLEQLREKGHRQFIVTKRSSRRLDFRLEQAGIHRHWFEGIFPSDHGPAPKPDPRCFEPVWEKVGWHPKNAESGEPARALYVGDRAEDQLVANRAGIPFVAVRTGPEAKRGFPGADAPYVLDSLRELPALLERESFETPVRLVD